MCKICTSCKGIMSYDPYFKAVVCCKCGKMERISYKEIFKPIAQIPNVEELNQTIKAW